MADNDERPVGSVRAWDAGVAVGLFLFGSLVVWESRRLGASWASDGPQAGYFPFYIGLFICIASAVNFYSALHLGERGGKAFVKWGQMRMILTVVVPSIVYVALIVNPVFSLGIYEASALFIAFFMWYLGKYGIAKILAVSIATMVVFFVMFEVWFLVPLPKGPLEALFGFR
jgi:putative tricarboxylic transport membrane protein